jgi:predicted acylesterase/phospholipase RssA
VSEQRKRALILAGGGLKVAFQAGVLQVWLDEARIDGKNIEFDLADGASGGVFNLAMWCSGKSGTEIANAWRNTNPLDLISLNPRPWVSLLTFDAFRKILPNWEIDWGNPRRHEATFNVYNFTAQKLQTRTPEEMNPDWLVACVTLPMWFPPMKIGDDVYVDAIYATDANLEAAIRKGADELWIIWTVSRNGRWGNGVINQYFQMVEQAANWRLTDLTQRIEASNAAIRAGENSEFSRHIKLKILCAEVPLHYLFVFSADRLREAVELGVRSARAWCLDNGLELPEPPATQPDYPTQVRFSETMQGTLAFGSSGTKENLAVDLTVGISGLYRFLGDPRHSAKLTGWVRSDALGGKLPIEDGEFNLFVEEPGSQMRKMLYRIFFRDSAGHMLTLKGEKLVPPELPALHPWRDTTTLFTRVLRGRVEHDSEEETEVAEGVIRITPRGLVRQLLSFRATGSRRGPGRAVGGPWLITRFLGFFLATLRRVYFSG